jgi:hypothetical protein
VPAKTAQNDTSNRYPCTFEIGGRRALNGIAAFFACFGVGASIVTILTHPDRRVQVSNVLTPVLVFSAIALIWAWRANQRVILHEDAIELTTWFSSRRLTKDQIAGYRVQHPQSSKGTIRYIIVPRDPAERAMKLPHMLRYNKAFYVWMKTVRPIDPSPGR